MRLISVNNFIERERAISNGEITDRRTKVFQSCDSEFTEYAILSHRWIEHQGQTAEVNYDEMSGLARMHEGLRDEIRQRTGYKKILDSCVQAIKDGLEWLWVDTCCIDRQSTAEISEAINSMFQWYGNSTLCYAYLHDVPDSSFPTVHDNARYPNSNGWPEWFSRGWTLQELIAPGVVQFFNMDWQPIGNKVSLSRILRHITRVPQYVIMSGLSSTRPCFAQIMSWAANRTTTLVEDRAYSLMGLLDVNMPIVYGEGNRAFRRLQLAIIRTSNDQSIFAWDPRGNIRRAGSVLADDPSFFRDCSDMHAMEIEEFIQSLKGSSDIPAEELRILVEEERLGSFPITTEDIPIWIPLARCLHSRSVFQATLACGSGPTYSGPVTIYLALWNSKYYRYFAPLAESFSAKITPEFQKISLSYEEMVHWARQFDVDDGAILDFGFTYCGTFPSEPTGKTLTLTGADPLFVSIYTHPRANLRFAVGFGHCFGQDWVHVVCETPSRTSTGLSWEDYAEEEYQQMSLRSPEHAEYMAEAQSQGSHPSHFYTKLTRLPRSLWTVKTSFVRWNNSSTPTVMMDIIRYPSFCYGPHKWRSICVDGAGDSNRDPRALYASQRSHVYCQDDIVEGIQFEEIRTHFCNLIHLNPYSAEDMDNDQNRNTDIAIAFFSELFTLENLKDYVGDISFSMIAPIASNGAGYSRPDAALGFCIDTLETRLRQKMALNVDGLTTWDLLPVDKRKMEREAELSSKGLGVMLLQDISAHYQSEAHESHSPGSVYDSIQSMVQEVIVLQEVFDTTKDLEEKWALEEDIIGKILWICWCGIHAEVEQVLPEALDRILKDETVDSKTKNIRTWYIGNIFEEAVASPPDDIQAHLLRVMADAETGVSKYQLLNAEKAMKEVRRSGQDLDVPQERNSGLQFTKTPKEY